MRLKRRRRYIVTRRDKLKRLRWLRYKYAKELAKFLAIYGKRKFMWKLTTAKMVWSQREVSLNANREPHKFQTWT